MKRENPDPEAFPPPERELPTTAVPPGVDRRTFMMRSAVIGSAAVITGCTPAEQQQTAAATAPPPQVKEASLSPDLDVVKKSKGPVMTTLEEFYKVGPGPSSSHTIGPMRITYDFYQRCTKLPADQLAKATALKVHLFGSLSATGKGHGTERAALAGIIGKEPATVDPAFLDGLAANPDQIFPVKLGDKTFDASLKDIIYDAPKGDFPHPNTMTCKLMGGDSVLLEQEYYSVGGGFIEWKGYEPPKKGQPKYPYATMKELLAHAETNKLSVAQVAMANEVAVSGKSEAEINAFLDKISTRDGQHRQVGAGRADEHSAGPDQAQDQGRRGLQARDGRQVREAARRRRRVRVRAGRLGGERPRPPRRHRADRRLGRRHAGARLRARRGRPQAAAGEDPRGPAGRRGRSATSCKHNATLSGAEGGCQAEIGVASAMGAALIAQAHDFEPQVVANAAESSLQHHLGMTCDPVAGFVQVPCIERCAFGAVKAWTGFMIASNEIPANRRVDFDTTVNAMALTAKEMNSKYKETSEGGLAVSVVLC